MLNEEIEHETIEALWEHEYQYMPMHEVIKLAKQAYIFKLHALPAGKLQDYVLRTLPISDL